MAPNLTDHLPLLAAVGRAINEPGGVKRLFTALYPYHAEGDLRAEGAAQRLLKSLAGVSEYAIERERAVAPVVTLNEQEGTRHERNA